VKLSDDGLTYPPDPVPVSVTNQLSRWFSALQPVHSWSASDACTWNTQQTAANGT